MLHSCFSFSRLKACPIIKQDQSRYIWQLTLMTMWFGRTSKCGVFACRDWSILSSLRLSNRKKRAKKINWELSSKPIWQLHNRSLRQLVVSWQLWALVDSQASVRLREVSSVDRINNKKATVKVDLAVKKQTLVMVNPCSPVAQRPKPKNKLKPQSNRRQWESPKSLAKTSSSIRPANSLLTSWTSNCHSTPLVNYLCSSVRSMN